MRVSLSFAALRQQRASGLAWRFALGGAITAAAGMIAGVYGPALGGLFLAFPAILPASLTLVARHQAERKAKLGLHGAVRGKQAAALDARGAVMGAVGLVGFAAIVAYTAARLHHMVTLALATLVWAAISTALWAWRKS